MTDEKIKYRSWVALMFYADELTKEQFDYCVHRNTWTALSYYADKLTEEQLDYCVHENPWTALRFHADKLTTKQKQYCKENTKEIQNHEKHKCNYEIRQQSRYSTAY